MIFFRRYKGDATIFNYIVVHDIYILSGPNMSIFLGGHKYVYLVDFIKGFLSHKQENIIH
jgi:hypothetical protein